MLVGLDENDSDFNTAGKTGGEKSHVLTEAEIPAHAHKTQLIQWGTGTGQFQFNTGGQWGNAVDGGPWSGNTGGNQPHNNMPPYYTVYIWQRVA